MGGVLKDGNVEELDDALVPLFNSHGDELEDALVLLFTNPNSVVAGVEEAAEGLKPVELSSLPGAAERDS